MGVLDGFGHNYAFMTCLATNFAAKSEESNANRDHPPEFCAAPTKE